MDISPIYWIGTLLFGLGLYLIFQEAFGFAAGLLVGFAGYLRRRFAPRTFQRLLKLQAQDDSSQKQNQGGLSIRRLLYGLGQLRITWLVLAVLAALILMDKMLSILALVVLLVGGELYRSQAFSRRAAKLNEDSGNLILQFESRYPVSRSLTKTLRDSAASLPGGGVREATEECIARLSMN